MENKTDKPYSLQDAKDEVAKIEGFFKWSELSEWLLHYISLENIEFYNAKWEQSFNKFTSKATEELRKENEELRKLLHDHNGMCQQKLNDQIKSVLPEIERLKESNKELVEALDDACENLELQLGRLGCTLYGDGKEHLADNDSCGGFSILEKSRDLIQKTRI